LVTVVISLEPIGQQAFQRLPFGLDRWHGMNVAPNHGGKIRLG
jgi:hypothetical protein